VRSAGAAGWCVPIKLTKTAEGGAGNANGLGSNSVLFGFARFVRQKPVFHNNPHFVSRTFLGE